MLTEIEWWGGLLFLWWALSFWFLMIATRWVKFGFQYGYTVGALILTAAALALFFYPLDASWATYLYIGITLLAVVCVGLLSFYPEHDDAIESPESVLEITLDGLEQTVAPKGDEEEDANLELVGNIVLLSPLGIILILSVFKSWQLMQALA